MALLETNQIELLLISNAQAKTMQPMNNLPSGFLVRKMLMNQTESLITQTRQTPKCAQ